MAAHPQNTAGGSIATNGITPWHTAFQQLYNSVLADPQVIWVDSQTRLNLGKWLRSASKPSGGYRLELPNAAEDGDKVGAAITGIPNEVTGTMTDLRLHPYMPPWACRRGRASSHQAQSAWSGVRNWAALGRLRLLAKELSELADAAEKAGVEQPYHKHEVGAVLERLADQAGAMAEDAENPDLAEYHRARARNLRLRAAAMRAR